MDERFQRLGAVYVLVNDEALRVKIGTTINRPFARLQETSDLWWGRKGSCQVCGRRLVLRRGRVPSHSTLGGDCPGRHAPPFEQDSSIAEAHLALLQKRLAYLTGVSRGSVTRKIATLERRIRSGRHQHNAVGTWELHTTFFTERAEEVEALSHQILASHLDEAAPIGEVFRCSAEAAIAAIECALTELGLIGSAQRESST